jgi:TRAP-type mannitol/chloroaromatic compound transport system permease small subunit
MMLSRTDLLLRSTAFLVVHVAVIFLVNNVLTFWWSWPGALNTLRGDAGGVLGWLQLASYIGAPLWAAMHVYIHRQASYNELSERVSNWAAYSIRVAFWMVLLVGMADMLVSFMRIESMLPALIGDELTLELGKPRFRGLYLHLPLMLLSFLVAWRSRGLGFIWLTLMVVVAEFMIVITRFIFSYEQAFMGDLVRFWYAALFLFASAHTLLIEGHIRVDVAYTHFSDRAKAWVNVVGIFLLGLPLCGVILSLGMWSKTSSINSPLISVEVSQSGYGMYVKYIMVGYLAIFAFSMAIQFASYLLSQFGVLRANSKQVMEP